MTSSPETVMRKNLLQSLDGRNAHLTFKATIKNFPPEHYNTKLENIEYSCWGLLEHMRIAQEDILDFIKNPEYVERKWPADYWPSGSADKEQWKASVERFQTDENEFRKMLEDETLDLFSPIPHAPDYTLFREILLIVNHNSYHTGQLLTLRKMLGIWPAE